MRAGLDDCVAMKIGDLVVWRTTGCIAIIISIDEDGDPWIYDFKNKDKILVFKDATKRVQRVPQADCR